ncbi:helix-turn-helix transcriptional regulator [Blautia sp. MSK20_18]|uniref:helix-turn-helix domain-containing protein n=1 Tax=unclassified Blautia TaxID=2648079 RepID=UPI001FC7F8E9|nr:MULTISPECIES: helix-turn-helix domain-containing protein [unclassified Blautia]MCB7508485.1 helix-turn-helix transcriptional regulator [Blautia sp. MSK20_18]
MAKRPVPKYDFKAFGAAIKAARTGRKESRKKVSDEMFISPRYLANIENKGQHPSLQIFFELMLRYNISVDQFLLETPPEKNTQRRQLDALLDGMSDPVPCLPAITDSGNIRTSFLVVAVMTTVALCPDFTSTV